VVRISVVYAERDNPFVAATIAPDHPRVRIGLATAYFVARGGRVPAAEQRVAIDALKQAPLADEPFLLAGVVALAAHDDAKGERLLTEARRRNPRDRMVRLLLLDRYLRQKRAAEAATEMAVLNRLITGAGTVLTQQLVGMVRDPSTAPQTIPILKTIPELQAAVLEDLARSDADPNLVLSIGGPVRPKGPNQQWQSLLLDRMVRQGDIARALEVWKTFSGLAGASVGKGLYDGDFRGLPGPPPFNWTLPIGGAGAAERTKAGLQVDYYGRDDADMASQLLVLAPGRYRFGFRAQGDASGEGSRLVWTLICHPAGAQLMQLPLLRVASAARRFNAAFVVPSTGCVSQTLKLNGVPGDVASAQNVTIAGLSIDREAAP
jgi:hypothetical protein